MPQHMLKLGTVLVAALITVGAAGWGLPALAAPKKPVKPVAPVPQTGQTWCVDGSGTPIDCAGTRQDGEFQAGVAWPVPRFTDLGNGTVRDNLTGLIWLRDAGCFGERTWFQAMEDARTLASGQCGLADGSVAEDWRLPNVRELHSLVDFGSATVGLNVFLPTGHPFRSVAFAPYWSATSLLHTGAAYAISFYDGRITGEFGKTFFNNVVWPVRVGE